MTEFSKVISNMRSSEIRDLMSLANKPGIILFSGGMPDNDLFPLDEIDTIYNSLSVSEKKIAMQYGPTSGLPELLDSLKSFLKWKGLPVEKNRLLITTGSLQAINILAKAFIDPGDPILVENPCFIGAISAFRSYEADIVSIPLKTNGIDTAHLQHVLDTLPVKPRFLYMIPNFHNPAGTLYSTEVRMEVISKLQGRDIPIIEDDVYSDLYFHDADKSQLKSIKEIDPEGIDVCYTGSFSKILGPGLRLGWMLVPQNIYEKCELIKQSFDACSPSFSQIIAHKFIESGAIYHYIERVRPEYKLRAEAMVAALKKYMPGEISFTEPRGGFYIWVQLPANIDATAVLKRTLEKGAVFVSGKTFDPHGIANNCIRLSFCNSPVEKIQKGIPLVAEAIREEMEKN